MQTPHRIEGHLPLRAYAMLGDMRGTALVGTDGAIDWLAIPVIDSPPLCAALLDPARGGSIELQPTVPFRVGRRYVEGTMVLETTFSTGSGTVRVTDSLNRGTAGTLPWAELARRVEVDDGEVPMRWAVRAGHGLEDLRPWCHRISSGARLVVGDRQVAVITDGLGEPTLGHDGAAGSFTARTGAPALLAVVATEAEPVWLPTAEEILGRIDDTVAVWKRWSDQVRYDGPWRDLVVRSALTLKALAVESSGAMAAAATTSLPEKIGGERNFDYRYAWIRDSSFAIDAMQRLGLSEEIHVWLSWLLDAVAQDAPELQVFYRLDRSSSSAAMRQVDAPGYRCSTPVQVGNSAASQLQLGSYGDLVDAVSRYVDAGGSLDAGSAAMVGSIADRVCDVWTTDDAGIWELGSAQPYTISKIGCWVALDRALRLADAGQVASVRAPRWRSERERIKAWIEERCWSPTKQAYTFYAGTDELDASVLLATRTGYWAGDDPRLASTIRAIADELGGGHQPMLYRYSGQESEEGTFTACGFWMIEALVHTGRMDEARARFEAFAALANDVGLYTEEIDPDSEDLLGNIPQALSHLALIGAANAIRTGDATGEAG